MLQEKEEVAKAFKQEIKIWKKKLGNERRMNINLERKLVKEREVDSDCSLLSSSIISTKPVKRSNSDLIEKSEDEPKDEETCNFCAEPIPNYTPKLSQ